MDGEDGDLDGADVGMAAARDNAVKVPPLNPCLCYTLALGPCACLCYTLALGPRGLLTPLVFV